MVVKIKDRLNRAFKLTYDLFLQMDETSLTLELPGLPSNRIADQVWCIVGARESYLRAIKAGEWKGFSCSLKKPDDKNAVLESLMNSQKELESIEFNELTDKQKDLAFDLLEHEIQHHGQLIRYIYGNKLTFPESWHERYTV